MRVAVVALGLLGLSYHAKGYWYLLVHPNGAADLHQRYREERYVFAGRNPNDVGLRAAAIRRGEEPPEIDRPIIEIPEFASRPPVVGYPPWAFFTQALLVWPPWPATRFYLVGFNLAATVFIGVWAYRTSAHLGRDAAAALTVACLSLSAYSPGLQTGNYPLIVTALLAASMALERRRAGGAGLALGLAMLKPHMAGPFIAGAACRGRLIAVAVATAYVVMASLVTWAVVKVDPLEMMGQMLASSNHWVGMTYGPLSLLLAAGLEPRVATPLNAALFLCAGAALHLRFRALDILAHYAIAGVVARLFAYHQVYDNLLLVFLLLALGLTAVRQRSAPARVAFLAVGLSLWPPAGLTDWRAYQVIQVLAWCGGLATLLLCLRNERPGAPRPVSNETPGKLPCWKT